jgi:glycosyltransferase involved in cell wall biosynthesis
MHMPEFMLLIPVLSAGENLKRTIDSLISQSFKDFQVVICTNGCTHDLGVYDDVRFRVLEDEFRNLAMMKYYVFRHWDAKIVAEISEGLVLHEKALEHLRKAFKENTAAVYGDYIEQEAGKEEDLAEVQNPYLYPGDLTERVNTGPLMFYNSHALLSADSYDPAFNTAHEYDLRLRLVDNWEFKYLKKTLATIFPDKSENAAAKSLGASKVFSPGEGPQGGFSYLFYGPAEDMEFETAFKNYIRRKGAYLSHKPQDVTPAGDCDVKVSVVIPFFNRGRFIGKAIESVINGSFDDFEIVCVDNCSTDDGAAVVREWSKKDSRVRLIMNDKNVIARALNLGVRNSRGQYIAQLDSDDEYTVTTLQSAVRELETNPTWGLAISYYELIEEDGTPLNELGIIKHLEYDPNNHLRVDGAGAIRVWHKSVIQELGGFDEDQFGDFAEDYDLVAKVAERWEVGKIHEVLYRYRRHPDNTDVKRSVEMKIANKTMIRHQAIQRRITANRDRN